MTVHIIGFTGPARSGKDTCANIVTELVTQYNDEVATDITEMFPIAREAFAGPLKTMVAVLLDFYGIGSMLDRTSTWEYIEGDLKETEIPEIGASPRKLMQTLGTDWGRNLIKDSLWVDSMKVRLKGYEEVQKLGYAGAVVLVTDVRFENEAQAIRDMGGTVVHVHREDRDPILAHESENGVVFNPRKGDAVLWNLGTVEELQKLLAGMLPNVLPFLHVPEQAHYLDKPDLREGAM